MDGTFVEWADLRTLVLVLLGQESGCGVWLSRIGLVFLLLFHEPIRGFLKRVFIVKGPGFTLIARPPAPPANDDDDAPETRND